MGRLHKNIQLMLEFLKVRLSTSKRKLFICLDEGPLKMMKNTIHFILKALIILEIFKFLSCFFGHVEKTA